MIKMTKVFLLHMQSHLQDPQAFIGSSYQITDKGD